jgi:hypothetical protein
MSNNLIRVTQAKVVNKIKQKIKLPRSNQFPIPLNLKTKPKVPHKKNSKKFQIKAISKPKNRNRVLKNKPLKPRESIKINNKKLQTKLNKRKKISKLEIKNNLLIKQRVKNK